MELNIHDHIWRETVIPLDSGGEPRDRFCVSVGDRYETFPTWEEAVAFFYSITNPSE
jgi:hypothetical protein